MGDPESSVFWKRRSSTAVKLTPALIDQIILSNRVYALDKTITHNIEFGTVPEESKKITVQDALTQFHAVLTALFDSSVLTREEWNKVKQIIHAKKPNETMQQTAQELKIVITPAMMNRSQSGSGNERNAIQPGAVIGRARIRFPGQVQPCSGIRILNQIIFNVLNRIAGTSGTAMRLDLSALTQESLQRIAGPLSSEQRNSMFSLSLETGFSSSVVDGARSYFRIM